MPPLGPSWEVIAAGFPARSPKGSASVPRSPPPCSWGADLPGHSPNTQPGVGGPPWICSLSAADLGVRAWVGDQPPGSVPGHVGRTHHPRERLDPSDQGLPQHGQGQNAGRGPRPWRARPLPTRPPPRPGRAGRPARSVGSPETGLARETGGGPIGGPGAKPEGGEPVAGKPCQAGRSDSASRPSS